MKTLVYPRERTLSAITLVLGLLAWLALILGTFGGALVGLAIGFVFYLFVQSALISYLKGNGVELSTQQFPDLHAQFIDCCNQLQIATPPKAYILNGDGGLNAFATKFLGTQYVVLLSDVVDAMDQHPDGVRFYIGHELGHLRMKHLTGALLRWPVLWLPLLGAAYSRAKESTCDRHGLACCATPEGAARALAALSAGSKRWKQLDVNAYVQQTQHTTGFWMSLHELVSGYPWLTKRAARVLDTQAPMPKRNPLAYVLAIFLPYSGRLGAGFGLLIMVYIVGVLAAVAIPAYNDYKVKAVLASTITQTAVAREAIGAYYTTHKDIPATMAVAGQPDQLPDGTSLTLDPDNMVLTAKTKHGELVFTPDTDPSGKVIWTCGAGEGLKPEKLPLACASAAAL